MEHYQIFGPQSSGNQPLDEASTPSAIAVGRSPRQGEMWRLNQAGNFELNEMPYGFIDSRQSSTGCIKPSRLTASEKFWTLFSSNRDYNQWQARKAAKEHPQKYLDEHSCLIRSHSKRSIFRLSQFPSGELCGHLVTLGREGKYYPSVRRGQVETHSLSNHGKTTIRRAIECATDDLGYFCTLTFDPSQSQLNLNGIVNHYWAKSQLHRFLDALTKICIRRGKTFKYLWVAEIQTKTTNNIHFHILWNQFFPIKKLTELWKQANNSVDIKRLKNIHHAKRYVMKYISKQEKTAISGNRYAISQGLRIQMQAVTYIIEENGSRREATSLIGAISSDIRDTGGYTNEWGFSIPMPERPRRTPQGTYPGVSSQISLSLLDIFLGEVPF